MCGLELLPAENTTEDTGLLLWVNQKGWHAKQPHNPPTATVSYKSTHISLSVTNIHAHIHIYKQDWDQTHNFCLSSWNGKRKQTKMYPGDKPY